MNIFSKRGLLLFATLGLVVVASTHGWRAYKRAKARRFVVLATQWLEAKDFPETARYLQSAVQADPCNVDAARLTAQLLEITGSPAAIGWRIRTAQLEPANMTNRLDWALTALKMHDAKSAQYALGGLDEKSMHTARYHKVAGALAWNLGKIDDAQRHYQAARLLEPDNPASALNFATIGLVSTNEEVASAGRLSLEQLATNGSLDVIALRYLALDATKHKEAAAAFEYTKRIVTNSSATFGDKLNYLNFLRGAQGAETDSWLSTLKQQATNSPGDTFALGQWLARNEGSSNALQWLSTLPAELQVRQPVPLVITECQVSVKDWAALVATVEDEDWAGAEPLRLAFESLALRSLGDDQEAQDLWTKVRRESARQLDQKYALAQLTSAWGWVPEELEVLKDIVAEFPREKWAVETLARRFHDLGQTQELETLLFNQLSAHGTNVALKASLAHVCLLRKSHVQMAHRLAKEAFDTAPGDPLVICTYAYSLLLQGDLDHALKTLDHLESQELQIPWVAACYGVIEAESGNKRAARELLERAQAARLLPEERELVQLAKARLL